jgi:hypothetical protein
MVKYSINNAGATGLRAFAAFCFVAVSFFLTACDTSAPRSLVPALLVTVFIFRVDYHQNRADIPVSQAAADTARAQAAAAADAAEARAAGQPEGEGVGVEEVHAAGAAADAGAAGAAAAAGSAAGEVIGLSLTVLKWM